MNTRFLIRKGELRMNIIYIHTYVSIYHMYMYIADIFNITYIYDLGLWAL